MTAQPQERVTTGETGEPITRRPLSDAQVKTLATLIDGRAPLCSLSTTQCLARLGLIIPDARGAGWIVTGLGIEAHRTGLYIDPDAPLRIPYKLSSRQIEALRRVARGNVTTINADGRTLGSLVRREMVRVCPDCITYRLTAAGERELSKHN